MNANIILEKELALFKIPYKKVGDDLYEISLKDGLKTISLSNVKRNYNRDNDEAIIKTFVQTIIKPFSKLPEWSSLINEIYVSIEPSDYDCLGSTIYKSLSKSTIIVLAHFNKDNNQVRWLQKEDLLDYKTNEEILWEYAYKNIDKITSKTPITFDNINDQLLGLIEAYEPYKASIILSKELKNKVSDKIGWPIYAVAPARDFVYLFSKDGGLVNQIGNVVVKEFKESGYPISVEVWELSDDSIKAIGAYPVN